MPKIGTRLEIIAAAAIANDVVAVFGNLNPVSMCPATMGIEELSGLGRKSVRNRSVESLTPICIEGVFQVLVLALQEGHIAIFKV